ncbi:MAG: DUF2284 domain-containing protein [Anaerovoracaceae bacterium]|jgi:predicted metal-binding protein
MKYFSYEKPVTIKEYTEKYVETEFILTKCQQCGGYGTSWSCPPFARDALDYWNQYSMFIILCQKVLFNGNDKIAYRKSPVEIKSHTDEFDKKKEGVFDINLVLDEHVKALNDELFEMEKLYPGSKALISGQCSYCGKNNCSRLRGEPCVSPENMHHSVESLGGNVVATIKDYFGFDIKWVENGELPDYFVQLGGVLLP